jgi:bifunctional DNA-binding transcriptional regulator/antitoxin component of YhaV-PrlF toxin-antitoxin module
MVVTTDAEGQLAIPTGMCANLGILPGTRVLIAFENKRIVLHPVTNRMVEELKGMLAGGPSLSDKPQREHPSDNW